MSTVAGSGVAVGDYAGDVLEEASRRAMDALDSSRADWALVFSAPEFLRDEPSRVQDITAASTVIGCGARGVIGGNREHENTRGASVLAVRSDECSLHPVFEESLQVRNREIGRDLARRVAETHSPPDLTCLFPDAYSFRSGALFGGVQDELPFHPILGGTASGDGNSNRTYQLMDDRVTFNSLTGFSLGGACEPVFGIAPAHHPVGPSFLITEGEGNMIAELDGEPALQVLFDTVKSHSDQFEGMSPQSIFIALSIDPEREYIPPNEYVVREVAGVDRSSENIAVQEQIQEGQRLSFAVMNRYAARENLDGMLRQMEQDSPEGDPLYGIYINCCGRGSGLYGEPHVDVEAIRDQFGAFPMIGFESNGELAPMNGRNYEHRYTGVLLLVYGSS